MCYQIKQNFVINFCFCNIFSTNESTTKAQSVYCYTDIHFPLFSFIFHFFFFVINTSWHIVLGFCFSFLTVHFIYWLKYCRCVLAGKGVCVCMLFVLVSYFSKHFWIICKSVFISLLIQCWKKNERKTTTKNNFSKNEHIHTPLC